MPTEPRPVSLYDVIKRAVDVCDQTGVDTGLGELLLRFEDADEPIADQDTARQRIDEAVGALDPEAEDGALQMAGAVASYLVYRRGELDDGPATLLRLAARAEYPNDPPTSVAIFLATTGADV